MKKSTYSFVIEVDIAGVVYVNSDSPLKAYRHIESIDDLQQLIDAMGDSVQWNFKIDKETYDEFDLGVIADEVIIADTEDYEDE